MQLSSGIWETGNNHDDGRMKLSSDLGQYREEVQD